MKREEGKPKTNQRKKETSYYCIFNDKSEQLSNKIKTIFKEHLDGLIMVEVEFDNEDQAINFQPPEWFGEDVSNDHRFRNVNLASINSLDEI